MYKRKLFNLKKKKIIKINYFVYFALIPFFIVIFFYFNFNKNTYLVIPKFKDIYYEIPINKGGKEINNLNKKGLHLSYNDNNQILLDISNINFSIQLLTNSDYDFVKKKRDDLLNKIDTIFLSSDLFIANINHNLGSEYLLLFKDFSTRIEAKNYCEKYTYFIPKCRIINLVNLD